MSDSRKHIPYVGPRPFEKSDRDLFFGRVREVNELFSLLVAHRAVLLYAQSGAGKTSLVNAGLIPQLLEEGFEVLPVARVRGQIPPDVKPSDIENIYVFHALMSWAVGVDEEKTERLTKISLADFFGPREHRLDPDGLPAPRVVIFDQFEELFTFYPERWKEREIFFRQVAEALEQDHLMRILFAIREDCLARLDPFTHLLPEKLRTRFRLEGLRKEPALLAVKKPLEKTDHTFAQGVAERLVEDLLRVRVEAVSGQNVAVEGEFVEPVQLQVVCRTLLHDLPPDISVITQKDLQTFGDVTQALSMFYNESITTTVQETGVKEGELRRWFETILVTPAGTRGTVYRGQELTGGISNAAVQVLEDCHIIRGESRGGALWYELTHDRLIEPIRLSNHEWLTRQSGVEQIQHQLEKKAEEWVRSGRDSEGLLSQEELLEAERWLRSPEVEYQGCKEAVIALVKGSRAEAERKRSARRKQWLTIAMVLVFFISALAGYAFFERQRARDQARLADAERTKAKRQASLASSRELAAAAIDSLDQNPDRSIILALYALDQALTPQAEGALHRAVQASHFKQFLTGHQGTIFRVIFVDGNRVATTSKDGTVKLWDAFSGEELQTLSGHQGSVFGVSSSDAGSRLASGGEDGTVKIWDALSGAELQTLTGHQGSVFGVASSNDGSRLASGGEDGTVKIWDPESEEVLRTLSGHRESVFDLVFSPDGALLATGSKDRTAKIWDVESGKLLHILSGHSSSVFGIAFHPQGSLLATVSQDQTAILWDAETGKRQKTFIGHQGSVYDVAFSPDGQTLATASKDMSVKVWDVDTGREFLSLPGSGAAVFGVAFSPEGRTLATASSDATGRLWHLEGGREMAVFRGHSGPVMAAAFDPDGKSLATGGWDKTAIIWDVKTGRAVQELKSHVDSVQSVAFSPDGRLLATGSRDKTAIIWDVKTGKAVQELKSHLDSVESVTFSPDGRLLATGGRDRTAKLWDVESGRDVLEISHAGEIFALAFSPDGSFLATASGDNTAKIWDVKGDGEIMTLPHSSPVVDVAFSPDGGRLATACGDMTTRIWDLSSRQELITLTGHMGWWSSLSFSPRGNRLLTASGEKVKVWNTISGEEQLSLSVPSRNCYDLALSPLGNHVATANDDGKIRLYILDREELKSLARKRVARGALKLTQDECMMFPQIEQCSAQISIAKGQRQARAGMYEQAIASFEKALQEDPALELDPEKEARKSVAPVLLTKGEVLARNRDLEGAVRLFEKALELDPGLGIDSREYATSLAVKGLREKGEMLARAGDIEDAVKLFEKALNLDPGQDIQPREEARSLAAESLLKKGEMLALAGDIEDANAQFREAKRLNPALQLDPENKTATLAIQGHLQRGKRHAQEGSVENAVMEFAKSVQVLAQDKDLYSTLDMSAKDWNAVCWYGSLSGFGPEVITACEKAVELEEGNGGYQDSRGVARALTGDVEGAIEDFKFYVQWAPGAGRPQSWIDQRVSWIQELEQGRIPFDGPMLKSLISPREKPSLPFLEIPGFQQYRPQESVRQEFLLKGKH
jgi:WD40 repeat protein